MRLVHGRPEVGSAGNSPKNAATKIGARRATHLPDPSLELPFSAKNPYDRTSGRLHTTTIIAMLPPGDKPKISAGGARPNLAEFDLHLADLDLNWSITAKLRLDSAKFRRMSTKLG